MKPFALGSCEGCAMEPALASSWGQGEAGSACAPDSFSRFVPPASLEIMPVGEQDVEGQLAALDRLLAQAPASGATAQRSLRQ